MTHREQEWIAFAARVRQHVADYTVPQYGDWPDDEVAGWSPQQCIDAIKRYCVRFGTNQRGPKGQLRDLLKIAHYAALAHTKLIEPQGGTAI